MIVVKTKNGDRFINDKAVTVVEHDRENTEVNVYGDKWYLFETVGVWPNFDKALEHLKDIKEKVGESSTVGIRVNDSHAE